MIMISSARTVMLVFPRVFCIICFSFYIHVCLLIAVGVWIILGSSWTMPRGKPQAAGRYHNVTFSVFHHQSGFSSCFMILLSMIPCHPAMVIFSYASQNMYPFLFSFFFALVTKTFESHTFSVQICEAQAFKNTRFCTIFIPQLCE